MEPIQSHQLLIWCFIGIIFITYVFCFVKTLKQMREIAETDSQVDTLGRCIKVFCANLLKAKKSVCIVNSRWSDSRCLFYPDKLESDWVLWVTEAVFSAIFFFFNKPFNHLKSSFVKIEKNSKNVTSQIYIYPILPKLLGSLPLHTL